MLWFCNTPATHLASLPPDMFQSPATGLFNNFLEQIVHIHIIKHIEQQCQLHIMIDNEHGICTIMSIETNPDNAEQCSLNWRHEATVSIAILELKS